MKIVASGPISSWQIDRETMKIMTCSIFLGSKFTTDGDCSHEIKRCLLLERKAITNTERVLKRRDITLLTKDHRVKTMFLAVAIKKENWTIKKAKHCRLDVFELWYWR